jgi:aldehyde:ferredoxin oxidoreductase
LQEKLGGYAGKILRVDLSKGKSIQQPLPMEMIKGFIGGTGFQAKILWEETDATTDPLGPENVLVFATGPLMGTMWTGSDRINVAAKSPLTGIWGESNAGGHFGHAIKYAGYDIIIIKGSSKDPVYLWIDDDCVEIRNAKHLWGKNVWEVEDILREELGDPEVKIASIGQAGENLVKYASIINYRCRAMARAGMGAVMGSKRLKAIAIRGTKGVEVADPEEFIRIYEEIKEKSMKNPFTPNITKYGTSLLVEAMNDIGRFPTKNFQTGVFPYANKISGDVLVNNYKVRDRACFSCYYACKMHLYVKSGPYAGLHTDQPEYETLNSLGGRVWNDDIETLIYANVLCNQYGIDTISVGTAISFMMELWEKGIITKEDTDGLDFSWGNKETIIATIHKIAKREGIGNILAEGVKKASEIIGKGSEKYAMHVKGLEISAQDGRAQKSMAIAHAASVRGADHLRHCTFYDEVGFEDAIAEKFGKQYLPEMADRLAVKYKGFMAKETEDFAIMVDSLPLCVSGGSYWPPVLWWKDIAKIYQATTGIKTTEKDLRIVAERVVNLKRAYNIRLCLDRRHDTLPARFLEEPAPDGPCKGQTVDLKTLLDDYYKHRGWDIETGLIPESKLKELGLDHVAEELRKIGKLPKTKS